MSEATRDGLAIRRVVIAGGGTAGWVAAAALVRHLGSLIQITLVESDAIGTVGVGESTIPTSRAFHKFLGIDEQSFMRANGASFKLGISFENWGQVGEQYFHSFGMTGQPAGLADFHHYWLEALDLGFGGPVGDYCVEYLAARQGRFATEQNGTQLSYAYHLDATAYARALRHLSESAGVRRVEGKIAEVQQDTETGFITALQLVSGERIEGDLFIDCTGFRGLLTEETLQTGYEDWSHWLPTNSAWVVQTESTGPALPFTRAIAHEAGWRWRIPLQHRVGNGLVYCSAFLSDDDACAKLIDSIEGAPVTEPRLIRYVSGRRKKSWNKNCLALGLSSGFVEPLESTSIHLIKIGITRLIHAFPFDGITSALTERYNRVAQAEMEHIRDFIILHYHLTQRTDTPFWRRMREMQIPESLAQRMALFEQNAIAYQDSDDLFRIDSWVQVLMGQGLRPRSHNPLARLVAPDQLKRALDDLRGNVARSVAALPSHADFLKRYCAAEAA